MKFEEFNLLQPVTDAVYKAGFTVPTEIQEQAIPSLMEGKDLIANAQTGTGKTAAFVLPILSKLNVKYVPVTRALILVPTRELALQTFDVCKKFGRYLKLRAGCIYGGSPQKKQRDALRAGVDILIATPGRLLDFIEQKEVTLEDIQILVLDEADRMLDMGFISDVEKIVSMIPEKRQTILASATMPKQIKQLASAVTKNPVEIRVKPQKITADTVQQYIVYCSKGDKKRVMADFLKLKEVKKSIIFTRTKVNADRLQKRLEEVGIEALVIHGNKSQGERTHTLNLFRQNKADILIATDVAARGIDVPNVTHVFNYELPDEAESYIHRIGRAGRAGETGYAVTLCCEEELPRMMEIQKLIKTPLEEIRTRYTLKFNLNRVPRAKKTVSNKPQEKNRSSKNASYKPQERNHSANPKNRRPAAKKTKRSGK